VPRQSRLAQGAPKGTSRNVEHYGSLRKGHPQHRPSRRAAAKLGGPNTGVLGRRGLSWKAQRARRGTNRPQKRASKQRAGHLRTTRPPATTRQTNNRPAGRRGNETVTAGVRCDGRTVNSAPRLRRRALPPGWVASHLGVRHYRGRRGKHPGRDKAVRFNGRVARCAPGMPRCAYSVAAGPAWADARATGGRPAH